MIIKLLQLANRQVSDHDAKYGKHESPAEKNTATIKHSKNTKTFKFNTPFTISHQSLSEMTPHCP